MKAFHGCLRLFSRVPDALILEGDAHLTPIPVEEALSSFSAIFIDENYYGFIHGSKREIEGLMAVTPECLVPLKARAWLDLTGRKAAGEKIDSKAIKKHKNDVFRLFQLLAPETRVELPGSIGDDLAMFLEAVEAEAHGDLKAFGLMGLSVADVFGALRTIYGIRR